MKRSPLALLLLVTLALAGCGSGEEAGSSARRSLMSLGTAPPGGTFFVVGGAVAQALNDHTGENNWEVTAEATKGSQENIRRLDSGELELALANSAISYFAARGEEEWEKPYEIRTVMTLAPLVALFVTPESSDVMQIADLRGRRVVMGPAGAGFKFFLRPLLNAHGLTYDDLTELNGTQAASVDMVTDGSAAAAFLGGAIPTPSITQMCASQPTRFVPFDSAAVGQLVEQYPFFNRATIPGGKYSGHDEEFAGMDVGSMHLITRTGLDEELVYKLTRAIYEQREQITETHGAGRAINPKNVVRNTGTPFHPGAIRFYKEIGIWPES